MSSTSSRSRNRVSRQAGSADQRAGMSSRLLTAMTLAVALLSAPWFAAPSASASELTIAGPAEVVDSDTLRINGVLVRLQGIDALETGQVCTAFSAERWACGQVSKASLTGLAHGRRVLCRLGGTDGIGRMRGTCSVGDLDLGAALVRSGLALVLPASEAAYGRAQQEARLARRGMWGSRFDAPWDWRRQM